MGDDQVNVGWVGIFGSEQAGFALAAGEDFFAFLEAREKAAVREEMVVEVDARGHDNRVQVEPPDPFGGGVHVEGVDYGGNLSPYLRCLFRE